MSHNTVQKKVPTLLVGAGQAGVQVAKEITARPDLAIRAVGFVDDDSAKLRTIVHGVPVLGTTADIPGLAAKTGAAQAIITIAHASGNAIRRIINLCDEAKLQTKIIPGLHEIIDGKVTFPGSGMC